MTTFKNLLNIETDSLASSKRTRSKNDEYLYKKFRNRVVAENRKSKTNYFHSYFTKYHGNMNQSSDILLSIMEI